MKPTTDNANKQAAPLPLETWPTTCPICGADTKWKLSGRGKHYGQLCNEHGFVAIRRNPAFPRDPEPRLGFFERLLRAITP